MILLFFKRVTASYPEEKLAVHTRQKEVQELWEQVKVQSYLIGVYIVSFKHYFFFSFCNLKSKAVDRRSRLEQAVGQQLFLKEAKSLVGNVFIVFVFKLNCLE